MIVVTTDTVAGHRIDAVLGDVAAGAGGRKITVGRNLAADRQHMIGARAAAAQRGGAHEGGGEPHPPGGVLDDAAGEVNEPAVHGAAEMSYDDNGQPLMLTGTLRDMTTEVAQQEAITHAAEEAPPSLILHVARLGASTSLSSATLHIPRLNHTSYNPAIIPPLRLEHPPKPPPQLWRWPSSSAE